MSGAHLRVTNVQQTQAARVAERFPRFLARFPTAAALADAAAADVLAEWSGLGYNRRAIALQRAAAAVAEHGWPRDVAGLERLPGIGPYTARAVASLAFGEPVGVVDTNVRRWLLRRFAGPDQPRLLQQTADGLASGASTAGEATAWTHASMEFGARICTGRSPRCDACPIADGCPSRGAPAPVQVPRQATFRGSDRAQRGALVRALAEAPNHSLSAVGARTVCADRVAYDRIVAGLERDELLHRSRGGLRLGRRPAATIGQ